MLPIGLVVLYHLKFIVRHIIQIAKAHLALILANIYQCFCFDFPTMIFFPQIRFFGGTHERALVKKSNTRPFHLPADEIGVLRRGSSSTSALPGGGFERAWNEVSKLQANIDSGYYTHSSGESDLPPSDDEYSDEIYLGPRRGKLSLYQRTNRTHSPHSSNNSTNRKGGKRRLGLPTFLDVCLFIVIRSFRFWLVRAVA